MSFQIPLHFEDLQRPAAAPWQATPATLRDTSPAALFELLHHDLQPVLSHPPDTHFNAVYSLITRYQSLTQPHRRELLSLIDALVRLPTPSDPTHVKLALFFTAGLASAASAAPCKVFDKSGREGLLEAAHALISSIPAPCPFAHPDRDQLAAQLVRLVLHVLEAPTAARDKNARPVLARCLAAALALDDRQTLPAVTALLHALSRHEHLPAPLAHILALLAAEGDPHAHFVAEFVREVATLSSEHLARDPTAAKTVAAFLGDLSERLPHVFRSNLALILSQLDGESYMVRNGVVHVIGALIRAVPDADDPLLDLLLERSHRDVHAFTRSKALQTWITLADANVVPNRLFPTLADMAASRLDDKAAAVRKYAAQLLASLLKNNPFGPALRKSHFQAKLDDLQQVESDEHQRGADAQGAYREPVMSQVTEESEPTGDETGDATDPDARRTSPRESGDEQERDASDTLDETRHMLDEANSSLPSPEGDAAEEPQAKEDPQITIKKRYYSTALAFVNSTEMGLETVYNMLRSKSVTDVSEAVSLLITAVQFQLEAASGKAVRKMLPLVLARESNIRQAAVQAYVRLLAPGGLDIVDEKEPAMAVAKGLTALGIGATTGELACLEALISAMCGSKEDSRVISPSVVAVLWDLFAGRVPGASDEQRRVACMLIGMVATERPDSLRQRIQVIESVGLQDPQFARWSCVALCKLPPGSDSDGRLSSQLSDLAKESTDLSTVEQAITAIFSLSPEPETIVSLIIRDLAQSLHSSPSAVDIKDLSRFLMVIGHVAVKELVRIEALVSEVRQAIANQARGEGSNEEEEQAAAEADKALELAEKELVSPKSLLGRYGNLARKIAADQSAPADLQASAVLCMAKLMCVQEKFCANNLRLLFSILGSSPEALVRSNSVTALGDLAFRFPNLVEPWSSHIYSALQDKDDKVRKNTLMALTHLILNDMIKVKGQIVGLAVCMLDKNERIADLARLFFHELARKSANAIYNILPDTISCMSKMEDLSSDDFKHVVSFLIGLMDKERHSDGMVEKLCHRFRTSESERETQDLAHCISLLNMSERGVKKLADNFKSYSSALSDDAVHTSIIHAVAKGNKSGVSQSCLQIIEELNKKIEKVRASADDDEGSQTTLAATPRSETTSTRNLRPSRKPIRRTRGRPSRGTSRKFVMSNGSFENDDMLDDMGNASDKSDDINGRGTSKNVEDTSPTADQVPQRSSRSRSTRNRKKVVTDDEESEDGDLEIDDSDGEEEDGDSEFEEDL